MIYENEQTLAQERTAIVMVAEKWGASAVKLPRRYSADFALLKGNAVKAWVEFKGRKNPMDKYPTYTVSLYKYMNLCALARDTGVPSFLIVEWEDRVGYTPIPVKHQIIFSGRKDRGDWEDVEPMVEIANSAFRIIGIK